MRQCTQPIDRVREAIALAHTIPGVSLELAMAVGHERLIVSDHVLGAQLTPCQLRAAILAAEHDTTAACFAALIERVEIRAGVAHIGGGVYQCTSADGRDERWFVTSLGPERVIELLERCHVDDDAVGAILKHDEALGVCAVCIMSTDTESIAVLDGLCADVLASALTDELVDQIPAAGRS